MATLTHHSTLHSLSMKKKDIHHYGTREVEAMATLTHHSALHTLSMEKKTYIIMVLGRWRQ